MTKRMTIMLLLVLVVFGGVFGMKWFGNKMMNQYMDAAPVPPVTITAGAVQTMTWDNSLAAVGSLVAVNGTDVTTGSAGIVTAIQFESGAHVEKGAPLLTLDSAIERGDYKRLQAQAELAELNRARRERLYKLEAIAKSDYDAVASEASAAKAAVEAQAAKLAQKSIRAPFSGELGIRRVSVGQFLDAGAAIVSLQSLDPIDIDFALPEQHAGLVQPGYKVVVRVESYPDLSFEGRVTAIEPRTDEATRNFKLRARLPNPDRKLRPGQFARVQLSLAGERKLMVLPRTAINYSSYGTSVFVVQKLKKGASPPPAAAGMQAAAAPAPNELEVVQRFVTVGESRGDFVAVTAGLKEGDQVATSGLLKLRNQQPVIINNSSLPKAEMDPKPGES